MSSAPRERSVPRSATMTVCEWCGARAPGGAATYARAACPECLRDLVERYAEGCAEALRHGDETAPRVAHRGGPQGEGGTG